MCRLYTDHHFSLWHSYLMAACIKTIKLCPSPSHNNHLRMCWVKFSKKLSFSESLHSACSVFVSFFLFLRFVFELLKRLGAPCMFFFLLLFSVLFFHHYPTALFCACKCFLNGVLSSLSGWMSLLLPVGWVYLFRGNWCVDEWGNEVHPHLAAPLPESLRQT